MGLEEKKGEALKVGVGQQRYSVGENDCTDSNRFWKNLGNLQSKMQNLSQHG